MITIKVIPHSSQRYDTQDDWQFDAEGNLGILVSDLGNEDMNNASAVHALFEALLCKKYGVTQEQVDEFDTAYNKAHTEYPSIVNDDPGAHPASPYHREHMEAEQARIHYSRQAGIDLQAYDEAVNALEYKEIKGKTL